MQEEFKELMLITEHSHGVATALISDVVSFEDFENRIARSKQERDEIVKSLFVLARAQLTDEINDIRDLYVPRNNGEDWSIDKSDDPAHNDITMSLSFAMNDNGDFELFVYFGGKANPQTSIIDGLLHAIEVVLSVESDF